MSSSRDLDRVIDCLTSLAPGIRVEQLRVAHPGADDDRLWFFTGPEVAVEVQLESSTGAAPFLVESTDDTPAETAATVREAISAVLIHLGIRDRTA